MNPRSRKSSASYNLLAHLNKFNEANETMHHLLFTVWTIRRDDRIFDSTNFLQYQQLIQHAPTLMNKIGKWGFWFISYFSRTINRLNPWISSWCKKRCSPVYEANIREPLTLEWSRPREWPNSCAATVTKSIPADTGKFTDHVSLSSKWASPAKSPKLVVERKHALVHAQFHQMVRHYDHHAHLRQIWF